jgi:Phosphoglycerate dehydrogenase and related dehydrogenases
LLIKSDVISLHTPQTPLTIGMIDAAFYDACAKPITLINTARGSAVVTADLVKALHTGQVIAAGLDVLEYEKTSFESLFDQQQLPAALLELMQFPQVLLSPHIAGWTHESHYKLAATIAQKIIGNHT